jgi:hypothetical protein
MSFEPRIAGVEVVLIGSFNPAIVQPYWLALNNLIRAAEAEEATVNIIAAEVSQFTAGIFNVQCTTNRFSIGGERKDFAALVDLMVNILKLLPQTPVTHLGLNFTAHFELLTEEAWHKVGDTLAPKDLWEKVFEARPGMRRLQVQSARSEGEPAGNQLITVEPSMRFKNAVFFSWNDHYDIQLDGKQPGLTTDVAIGLLSERAEASEAKGFEAFGQILKSVLE